MQLQQRHVATRVWKVLEALAKRIARALIVPLASAGKNSEGLQTQPRRKTNHYNIHILSRILNVSINIEKV